MKLKGIPRTASVAWSPIQSCPAIATGTMAGALDESFSNTTELEIFKLDWGQKKSTSELEPSGVVSSNARFNRLAWTSATGEFNMGLIAGGMENGELDFWNPEKILAGASSEECLFSRQKNHSGAIKGLDFNPFQPNLLASGAANGEVFIWNLGDLTKPYTPGPKSSKLEDITCLKWNQKVQHILATSSTSGYTVVWDLKNRREVMSLGYMPSNSNGFGMSGSRGITAVAWNPESATQLVTASEDDNNPVIMLWDLRNANAPEKVFSGHTKGVLSLSWCRQDNDLLLSCGKDNRTICWNPNSGEIVGEFAPSKNWSFDVQFSPRNPNLLSTSSFDNQVSIYSLLSSEGTTTEASVDDDPFTQAIAPQTTSFSLKHPPKWFRRPVGASFGFGGQLTSFRRTESSEKLIVISSIQIEPEVINRADELATAINSNAILEFCEKKASQAQKDNDKLSWDLMRLLLDKDGRNQINQILEVESKVSDDSISKVMSSLGLSPDSPVSTKEAPEEATEAVPEEKEEPVQDEFSNLFQGGEDSKKEDDFFSNSQLNSTSEATFNPSESKVITTPFAINANASSLEGLLSQMVVLGDFKGASELSLKAAHYDDALLFAMCGGKELIDSIKQKVFTARREQFSYLRLLENVLGGNFMDVVLSADLSEWKQIVSMINTYVQGQDLKHLYSALGSRLAQAEDPELRQNALLCFLLASSLEDAVSLWISELAGTNPKELEVRSQLFSDHFVLQDLIEKVTVFSKVISSDDEDSGLTNSNANESKLNLLYSLYYEYSVFMTSQGRLDVASSYLQMIPQNYSRPSDSSRDDYAALKYQLSYAGVDVGPLDVAYPFDFIEIGGSSHKHEAEYSMPSQNTYQPPSQNTYQPPIQNTYQPPVQNTFQTPTQNYGYDGYGTQQAYPSNVSQQTPQPQYGGYQTNQFQATPMPLSVPNPVPSYENSALYTQYPNYPPNNSLPAFPTAQQDAVPPPSAQKGGPAWNDPPAEVFSSQTKSIPKSKSAGAAAITSPFGATGPAPPTPQGYNYGAPAASLPPPPQGGRAPAPLYSRKDVSKPPSNPQRTGFHNQTPQQVHPPAGFHTQMPQQSGFINQTPPQSQPPTQPPAQPTPPQRPLYQMTSPAPPSQSPQGNAQGVTQNPLLNGPPGPGTPRPNFGNIRSDQPPRPPQQSTPPKPQPVAIDRSKMPVKYKPLVDLLSKPLNALKVSGVPPPQQRMLADVDRRISQLLDSMNQDTLHPSLVEPLTQFGKALETKDFNQALSIQTSMVSNQVNQVGPWVAGLKHLVSLLRAQPV